MRSSLLCGLLLLGLCGCLEPVDSSSGRSDASSAGGADGSAPLPGDASVAPADASLPGPDAGTLRCSTAAECPAPVQTDPCSPLRAACSSGTCAVEPDPGACRTTADCDCQGLTPASNCLGSWQCAGDGRCLWLCGGCSSDTECLLGEVCQEVSCGAPRQCTAGCRSGAGCPTGEVCGPLAFPKCGEPYGACQVPETCDLDTDCPAGSVCDYTWDGAGAKVCQTGCHAASQCGAGEKCGDFMCGDCATCPCFGICMSTLACTSDAECAAGEVCAADYDCALRCLVGCRDDSQCRPDQQCPPLWPCDGCGCDHQTCEPREVGCTDDAQCAPGQICAYDDTYACSGARHCVEGCLTDDDCLAGVCLLSYCGPCCPGSCIQPAGCVGDEDCPDGQVCEYGAGCAGARSCVDGCRAGSKPCLNGETCLQASCLTCPCPDVCGDIAVCTTGEPACSTTLDCSWQSSYCSGGCCDYCPVFDAPMCEVDQCLYSGGVTADGCDAGPFCAACCVCPDVYAPVCAVTYATFSSECAATCAGVAVLHAGECEPFEGMGCASAGCPTGQYCRDTCPMCGGLSLPRCTLDGACVYDSDCPAGVTSTTPGCRNPVYTCEADHSCSAACP